MTGRHHDTALAHHSSWWPRPGARMWARWENIGRDLNMGTHDVCVCVRHSRRLIWDAETRVMRGLACWRDSISIIETLGPLSMSRMRLQFLSYISHLSILRWLGMRGECEASDWSLSRQHGPLIGCEDAGGWSGSGWWWWPRYEYSGSITNGGKKPAESLAPIQTQGSQDWKQGNMMFMSMSCQLSMSTIMQIFHLIADGLLYVCTEEFFCC